MFVCFNNNQIFTIPPQARLIAAVSESRLGAQAPSSLSIRREMEAEDLFSSSGLQATLALESRKPSLERSHFWHQVVLEI